MTRRCCCTCSASVRPPIPCPGELRRVGLYLPVEEGLRLGAALLRAALQPTSCHTSGSTSADSGRLHARARPGLLREQPPGDLRAAAIRHPQHPWNSRATGNGAGASRRATAPAGTVRSSRESSGASSTTSPGGRRTALTTAPSPLGRGGVAAVRSRDRAAHHQAFQATGPGHGPALRLQATFNQTFTVEGDGHGWVSPWHFGIDQGPIILMIENYRSGLLWGLMRALPLRHHRAAPGGFRNGCYDRARPRRARNERTPADPVRGRRRQEANDESQAGARLYAAWCGTVRDGAVYTSTPKGSKRKEGGRFPNPFTAKS